MTRSPADPADPDSRRATATLRRAGLASVVVAGAVAAAGLGTGAASGGSGRSAAVVVVSGVVAGVLAAAGWLLGAILVDLLADRRPTRRVLVIAAVLVLVSFVSPMLVLGALATA